MTDNKITHVAAGILIRADGQFLLGSRPQGKPYAGWWEFPGGKLEQGETPRQALDRELHEEMGIVVQQAHPWLVQTFAYPHATVRLNFFKVCSWSGEPQPHEGQAFVWQTPGATTAEPILPANTPILRGLQLPAVLALSNVAELGEAAWLARLEARLEQGLRWLVLREPGLAGAAYAALAQRVLDLARRHGARVLLHDAPALAEQLGADGVHLSARALMATQQRPAGWLGASVHSQAELEQAAALGVDYAVLGTIKPTLSHPHGPIRGWAGFAEQLMAGWPFPVYGIGGLAAADLPDAYAAGAQGIAALRWPWREGD
ncbi:Nudix family hydrolase [Chitinimonas sp.]|uniref:Nudix family hydrolase n=1 Tax=Chitinimonas sp. TaxID=1934313 RepID=UPI0035B25BA4